MLDKQRILSVVKEKGPVLPRDVVREVGGDTFLVGAMLSQLVDNKLISISSAKIGGSPVYYASGQEEKLQDLYNFLPPKEKEAFDYLKDKKLIRDREAVPAIRVALRQIKDFAKGLEVHVAGNREIFWKWYLLPNQDAEQRIRKIILDLKPVKEVKKEQPTLQQTVNEPEVKQEEKTEELKVEPEVAKEEKQTALEEPKKEEKKPKKAEDTLVTQVEQDFSMKQIDVLQKNVVKKNKDIELMIGIPSSVGKLSYFCKVVKKKKINDKDLSSAFVAAQAQKLPLLFMTTGELTKKAKEMLKTDLNMITFLNF